MSSIEDEVKIVKSNLQEKSSFSDHSKWGFLKYEIHKFSISSSKNLAKTEWIVQKNLENRIKVLSKSRAGKLKHVVWKWKWKWKW